MIADLLNRLFKNEATEHLDAPDARIALAALLVRVARTDGNYDFSEIARIDRILAERYGLSEQDAEDTRHKAEKLEADAPDTVRFTRALKAATPHEERAALMQALWYVALGDGLKDAEEERLLRMIASLLGLTDVASALARQKAEKQ